MFVYRDFLREKHCVYWFVFFLDTEDIESLCIGTAWIFSKGKGAPELIPNYGAQ